VFPNSQPRSWINSDSAETRVTGIVHEIGHNFGLYHQSDYDVDGNLTSEYSNGLDSLHGALMGVDYRRDVQKWFIGHPNTSASLLQDDVAVIANVIKRYQPTGGDGFRDDDFGGTFAAATTLTAVAGGRSASGNIERLTDVDMFSFTTTGTGAVISVVPTKPSGLDAKLEVFDATGAIVAASDGSANEQQFVVPAGTGTWYVSVSSAGNYGDLGLYDLTVNDLPAGWTSADVGNVGRLPGDATFGGGTFTVSGSGAAVGGTADAFRFAWQTLTGDGSIVAHVIQNQATNPQAKAGVMIRESLAANSKHVAMVTTATQGPQLISRSTTGGSSATVNGTAAAFTPTWVRLVRTGNVITAARSADGVSWTTVGTVTVSMSATVRIGLLTSAQDAKQINTARFTNVSLTGTLNPPEAVNGLAPPANVSVSQGGGLSLVVRWQAVAGATGYRIERSENGVDFSSVFDAASTATSWTNTALPGALRYFYRVRALSASGQSAASAVASAINRPSSVTSASIAPLSSTQLILNWRDTSGETGYRIERSTDNVSFTQIATVAANVPSYTAGGLAPGTPYWFRISPMTSTGDSNPVVVTRSTGGMQAVGTPWFTSKSSSAIGIEWTAVASATNYRIERSGNGTTFTTLATVAAGTLAYTDATVAVLGKYYYRVVAINGTTVADPSPTIFTAAPRTTPLPAPWTAADVGSVAGEGATGLQSGTFILVSSGTAIGGPADSFRFTSQPLVGDGSIIARVSLQDTTGSWAKAGVMIRETTDVNARQAVMVVSPTEGIAWQYRHNIGGNGVTTVTAADQIAPVWLRLVREGNTFTGSWSSDGVTWTQAGSTTVAMGPNAVIGLVSTSDDATRLNRAEFTNVTATVARTLTAIAVSPVTASLVAGTTQQFSASATDQFGVPLATQPSFTWAVTGGGSITTGGLFAAPATAGVSTITASASGITGQATVTTTSADQVVTVADGQTETDSGGRTGVGALLKRGGGRLVLAGANTHSGGIVVEAGELVIRDPGSLGNGVLEVRAGARVMMDTGTQRVSVSRLNLAPAGTFDLATGSIILAPGSYDLAGIRGSIGEARGNGSWSGAGMTSTSIRSGTPFEVGHLMLPDGSLVVGFAGVGDLTLDGVVDFDDTLAFVSAGRYDTGLAAAWDSGDFDYSGFVDFDDVLAMVNSGLYDQGPYLPSEPQQVSGANATSDAPAEPVTSAAFNTGESSVSAALSPVDLAFALFGFQQQDSSDSAEQKKSAFRIL